jgi:GNAT superfamily N-acetyltransferase
MPQPQTLFGRYTAQRRAVSWPGFARDPHPHLVRYLPTRPGLEAIVMFAELATADVDRVIGEQTAFFAARGLRFEWKHHELDRPPDLSAALERHGFRPGATEALMLYPLSEHVSRPARSPVTIERVTTPAGIRRVVDIQERVWGEPLGWLAPALEDQLATQPIYLACVDGEPAGTGWIDFVAGSEFADLHGGAVLPEFRGRGLYSALFDVRAEEAKTRGFRWLAVDAAPMSRPILLRRGFQFICHTTPYRLPRPENDSAAI